jgi:hypothetical protein
VGFLMMPSGSAAPAGRFAEPDGSMTFILPFVWLIRGPKVAT